MPLTCGRFKASLSQNEGDKAETGLCKVIIGLFQLSDQNLTQASLGKSWFSQSNAGRAETGNGFRILHCSLCVHQLCHEAGPGCRLTFFIASWSYRKVLSQLLLKIQNQWNARSVLGTGQDIKDTAVSKTNIHAHVKMTF